MGAFLLSAIFVIDDFLTVTYLVESKIEIYLSSILSLFVCYFVLAWMVIFFYDRLDNSFLGLAVVSIAAWASIVAIPELILYTDW